MHSVYFPRKDKYMEKNDYREKIIEMVQEIKEEDILRKIYVVTKTYYEWIKEKRE